MYYMDRMSLDEVNNDGMTPLSLARAFKNKHVVVCLYCVHSFIQLQSFIKYSVRPSYQGFNSRSSNKAINASVLPLLSSLGSNRALKGFKSHSSNKTNKTRLSSNKVLKAFTTMVCFFCHTFHQLFSNRIVAAAVFIESLIITYTGDAGAARTHRTRV